jgi:hypothetical protein
VYGDIRKCKIRNWEQRSKNREDWMRSIKEAKAHRVVEPSMKKKKKLLKEQKNRIAGQYSRSGKGERC